MSSSTVFDGRGGGPASGMTTTGSGGFWHVFHAMTAPMTPSSSSASAMNFPFPLGGTPAGGLIDGGGAFGAISGGNLSAGVSRNRARVYGTFYAYKARRRITSKTRGFGARGRGSRWNPRTCGCDRARDRARGAARRWTRARGPGRRRGRRALRPGRGWRRSRARVRRRREGRERRPRTGPRFEEGSLDLRVEEEELGAYPEGACVLADGGDGIAPVLDEDGGGGAPGEGLEREGARAGVEIEDAGALPFVVVTDEAIGDEHREEGLADAIGGRPCGHPTWGVEGAGPPASAGDAHRIASETTLLCPEARYARQVMVRHAYRLVSCHP